MLRLAELCPEQAVKWRFCQHSVSKKRCISERAPQGCRVHNNKQASAMCYLTALVFHCKSTASPNYAPNLPDLFQNSFNIFGRFWTKKEWIFKQCQKGIKIKDQNSQTPVGLPCRIVFWLFHNSTFGPIFKTFFWPVLGRLGGDKSWEMSQKWSKITESIPRLKLKPYPSILSIHHIKFSAQDVVPKGEAEGKVNLLSCCCKLR